MHIPDGFLSNEVAVACAVPAVAAVGFGLRRAEVDLDDRRVPLLGVTAAFVFAAQMLNFPVAGGTSGHFLGRRARRDPARAVAREPRARRRAGRPGVRVRRRRHHARSGRTSSTWACIGGLLVGGLMLAARSALPKTRGALLGVAGGGAWLAVMAGAAACAVELAISGTVPLGTVLPAMLGVHAVIGLGEAVITVAAVSAVLATRPDLIHGPVPATRRPRSSR